MTGQNVNRAFLVCDHDGATAVSDDLKVRLGVLLGLRGYATEVVELGRSDAAPCRGCLLCLTKHPGECVTKDVLGDLVRRMNAVRDDSITVFITPVVFGHPSSIIKNAIDRGAGSRTLQVFVGYGEDIDEEEESTFIDLIARHRGSADIVHPGMEKEFLGYVTRSEHDNASICDALKERL
jgi:hypothetical protein